MGKDRNPRHASGRPASPGYRADVLGALNRLMEDRSEVTRGKMFGFPAFFTAGRLFACVFGEGVGLKLPQEIVRTLDRRPGITPFRPYGKSRMKEWIQIHHDCADAYTEDSNLFLASIAFVSQAGSTRRKPLEPKRVPKRS